MIKTSSSISSMRLVRKSKLVHCASHNSGTSGMKCRGFRSKSRRQDHHTVVNICVTYNLFGITSFVLDLMTEHPLWTFFFLCVVILFSIWALLVLPWMKTSALKSLYYQMTAEVDWASTAKSPTINRQNSTALDFWQKEEERKTKDNMEEDSRKWEENHEALLGVID